MDDDEVTIAGDYRFILQIDSWKAKNLSETYASSNSDCNGTRASGANGLILSNLLSSRVSAAKRLQN